MINKLGKWSQNNIKVRVTTSLNVSYLLYNFEAGLPLITSIIH